MGIVASLHNKTESSFGNNVREVLQVASTVWPISFAAVIGPFLRTLALYKAEKGSTLGTLEFLSSSQTTASAFLNLALLGGTQVWTYAIVVIWGLSPLGGQAALRSLSLLPNSSTIETPAIHYLGSNLSDLNPLYGAGIYSGEGDWGIFYFNGFYEDFVFDYRKLISAAFSTPYITVSHANGSSENFDKAVEILGGKWEAARMGHRDPWRNVRVPVLELLPEYDKSDPTAWVPVPSNIVVSYASFIGIPIRGGSFPRAGNSTMVIGTNYQTVSCGADFNGSSWITPTANKFYFHKVEEDSLVMQTSFQLPVYPNIFLDAVRDSQTLKEHIDVSRWLSYKEPNTKLRLVIGGPCTYAGNQRYRTFLRTCDLSTTYVDVEVSCTRLTTADDLKCQVVRLRHATGFPIAGNRTALSNYGALRGMVWELPRSTADYDIGPPSVIEQYLKDPTDTFVRSVTTNQYPGCFTNVSLAAFEARFATVVNTVIRASFNATVLTGADGTSLENRNMMWKNTTATWTEFTESIYALNKGWFAIWLIATLVLSISAIANIAIRAIVMAPDFMNSVAGLTRDSPYVNVPQDQSGASGSDRLMRLKRTEVKICDVQPDADVGRIAFTTDLDGRKLNWGRLYE